MRIYFYRVTLARTLFGNAMKKCRARCLPKMPKPKMPIFKNAQPKMPIRNAHYTVHPKRPHNVILYSICFLHDNVDTSLSIWPLGWLARYARTPVLPVGAVFVSLYLSMQEDLAYEVSLAVALNYGLSKQCQLTMPQNRGLALYLWSTIQDRINPFFLQVGSLW